MSRNWVDKKDYIVLILVFVLLPVASQAGGLGIAAITALGGGLTLIGLGPAKIISIFKSSPKAFWALMALLIYGLVSSIWSPYVSKRSFPNPMILVLGLPLYFLFVRAVLYHSAFTSLWLRRVWLWGTIGSAIAIFIDLTTGYSISLTIDPVSANESLNSRRGDLAQNLGHGVAVLALLYPAVAVTVWQRGTGGKAIAAGLAILILLCGYFANMSASIVALLFALLFMVGAAYKPSLTLAGVHIAAAFSVFLAPIATYLVTKISDAHLAALPFSWEERIHNWRYILHKITEHPIIGHGFDAVRTFEDKHTVRGFADRAIVSLHPHNAGLHIWVELGAIGILIAIAALFFSHKMIRSSNEIRRTTAVALSGTGAAAIVNASLTFGVWQDWWWAAIIISMSTVAFIHYTPKDN